MSKFDTISVPKIKSCYHFETYEGDDDFLLSKIMELDNANELLLGWGIPELWQLIQPGQNRGGEVGKTVVVNKYAEDFDVDIMRPSIWSNPFRIGRDGTREEVLQKFYERTKELPHLIELAKEKLQGKVLGCCCKPQACHGDVWVRLIEGEGEGEGESGEKE
jgi:hypothetical protein